jgi:hypothetical protein
MKSALLLVASALALVGCTTTQPPVTKLEKVNVLPLALDEDFSFQKQQLYFLSGEGLPLNRSEPVNFERNRKFWGAIDQNDKEQRFGNYYSFFWRARREADVTVRLEYRQPGLGNYVMAQERFYPAIKGTHRTDFEVIGDDYAEFGRVNAWRVLLIVDGNIVAFTQSFIWK